MSLLCTSIVISATITLRRMSGICSRTINVNYLNCFTICYRFPSIFDYYMLCSVFDVQIICDATATTCDGYFLIHSILVG